MGLPHGRMRIRIRKNYRRARRRHLLLGVCLTISSLLFWIGSDVLTLPNLLSQSQRQTATTGKSYLKNHDGRWNDDRSVRYLVFSLVASSTSDRTKTKTKTNTPNSPRSYVTAEKNDSVHLVTAASATLASLCTQSIVGGVDVGVEMGVEVEEAAVYDVIVVDAAVSSLPQKQEHKNEDNRALPLLAQRLRQRFPGATMVFVLPPNYYNSSNSSNEEPEEGSTVLSNTITEAAPGTILISTRSEWFEEHHQVMSSTGYREIAKSIQGLLVNNVSEVPSKNTVQQRNRLGTWGSGDSCLLWYENDQHYPTNVLGLTRHEFAPHKHALEVPSSSDDGGSSSSMTIPNPFGEERLVYLTYMTTSALSSSNKVYPRTRIEVNGKNSVVLDPYHNDNQERGHVTRTTAIGKLPAVSTSNTIAFFPVEEHTLAPFRIVGVSLLPKPEKRRQYKVRPDFTMTNSEPVLIEQD